MREDRYVAVLKDLEPGIPRYGRVFDHLPELMPDTWKEKYQSFGLESVRN